MSSLATPKEQQTAWQRWELAALGAEPAANDAPASAPVPTVEALAAALEQARREGYQIGLQQGFDAGMQDAAARVAADHAEHAALMARVGALADGFAAALRGADEAFAPQLLALALDIAKAMLKNELTMLPEAVLPVVRDAIRYLPQVTQPARLLVHPADAELLRQHLGDELAGGHWQIVGDETLERGGCRVETGANQIDAGNATRWQRIVDALAQRNDWNA